MMLKKETYADLTVRALTILGVRHAFGVPGGAIEPLYDALFRAEKAGALRLVTSRHEASSVAMAEGVARTTGYPAICGSTTGPGALNMLTAAASAAEECQPILIFTGQAALSRQGRGALQESSDVGMDTVAIFSHVCKFSSAVTHPDQLLPKLRQAWMAAMTSPRGPVHLSIPQDVFKVEASSELCERLAAHVAAWDAPESPQGLSDLQRHVLARHFEGARNPVLVLGEESRTAATQIRTFLASHNWPVVSTFGGHGWLDSALPNYYGELGLAGHTAARDAIESADAVLVVGSYFRDLCMSGTPAMYTRKVLHVAPSSKAVAATTEGTQLVRTSIRMALECLGELLQPLAAPSRQPVHSMPDLAQLPFDAPPAALAFVLEAIGGKQVLYLDAGNTWCWASHYLKVSEARQMVRSSGQGQMAWAIPTSIGATLGQPDVTSIAVTGDGAWLMSSHELTTAVQEAIPTLFIVLKDGQLGMVKHGQAMGGGEPAGNELPPVDYVGLAKAQGANALQISTPDDLEALRAWAQAPASGPMLIELCVDAEFSPPMHERVAQLKVAA